MPGPTPIEQDAGWAPQPACLWFPVKPLPLRNNGRWTEGAPVPQRWSMDPIH